MDMADKEKQEVQDHSVTEVNSRKTAGDEYVEFWWET
jgi:hypothetical protein